MFHRILSFDFILKSLHLDNSWSNNDRLSTPNDETLPQQTRKLQILGKKQLFEYLKKPTKFSFSIEQLQHVEKELHDKAQEHLQINQEYRRQVTEYVHSNSTSGKKKRTTSSSSTSSSSSTTSSTSNPKPDETSSSNLPLPIPPQTINFFSTSTTESNPSNNLRLSNKLNLPSSHHNQHHSKIKKSFNRQSNKNDRRLEQNLHDKQTHLDEMNLYLKNLKLVSPTSSNECPISPTKMPMHINTDTQKALEHLRELANNPSDIERIQTLANHPNLIHEIRKVANQSFSDQLKTLPPFTPSNLLQTNNEILTGENKTNHDQTESVVVVQSRSDSTVQTVPSSNQNSSIQDSHPPPPPPSLSLPSVNDLPPPPSPSLSNAQHSNCCAECPSKSTNIHSLNTLSHLRFQNRIDVDCETESNHDTALTLSCAGGHEELVTLLLQRGANIEHRDKKGFTPLILAGTWICLCH